MMAGPRRVVIDRLFVVVEFLSRYRGRTLCPCQQRASAGRPRSIRFLITKAGLGAPLLPDRTPRRGGRWRDHHRVIDAIAFKYRTGTPWMDLPEQFGSWKGAHRCPL
ncbi:transposase [Streptomyces sp. NPDC059382]|uniref:transposase n=1 Tax=Streptomyces sp. NPDC059382 TaxID=3346816 RepID=UPI0036B1DDCF